MPNLESPAARQNRGEVKKPAEETPKPPFTREQKRFLGKMERAKARMPQIDSLSEIQHHIPDLSSLSKREQLRHLPEIFALAGRAIELTTGLEMRDTQFATAYALSRGKIAELPSGEGKTLATGMATVFKALTNESVHVVTANDYLARRDLAELGEVYTAFGLQSGVIFGQGQDVMRFSMDTLGEDPENFTHLERIPFYHHKSYLAHQQIYGNCNIIYGTVRSLVADEQVDTLTTDPDMQRRTRLGEDGHRVAIKKAALIADEVDKLAIDDATTPQILSNEEEATPQEKEAIIRAHRIALRLAQPVYNTGKKITIESGDYDIIEDPLSIHPSVVITDSGWDKIVAMYGMTDEEFFKEGSPYEQLVRNAVQVNAKFHDETGEREVFENGRDYIVDMDFSVNPAQRKVILIDPNTGRPLPDNVLGLGLHQAIEAKEGFSDEIHGQTTTFAETTVQSFLRSYEDFAGTTGTAIQDRASFRTFYKKDVEVIPPHKASRLRMLPPDIYPSDEEAFAAIPNVLHEAIQHSLSQDGTVAIQPFIIPAGSDGEARALYKRIGKDERIKKYLSENGIQLHILDTQNLTEEANRIAEAGRKNTITVTTAIAGRGTHIELGGKKPTHEGKLLPEDSPEMKQWEKDHQEVADLGGLFVLAATVPPTSRALTQLARRAGRNGEPGTFKIISSIYTPIFIQYGVKDALDLTKKKRIIYPWQPRNTDGSRKHRLRLPYREDYFDQHEFGTMIAKVQDRLEGFTRDALSNLVQKDDVYHRNRIKFVKQQSFIEQHTDEWLNQSPSFLSKALDERLKMLHKKTYTNPNEFADAVDEALAVHIVRDDKPFAAPLATATDINKYLEQKAKEEEKKYYPLFMMSPNEQEAAIRTMLLEKLKDNTETHPAKAGRSTRIAAQQLFNGLWSQHINLLEQKWYEANFRIDALQGIKYAAFASETRHRLNNDLDAVQLGIIAQLLHE